MTVLTAGADHGNGDIFIAPFGGTGSYANGPEILSPSGRVIWFHAVPAGQEAAGFRVQAGFSPSGALEYNAQFPAGAQALWLLDRAGKLTFKPGTVPWYATTANIASNPENYRFTFIDYGDGPRVLPDVDAVIAYNMQFIGAGISQKYKIYAPPAPRAFAGQLVVSTTYRHDPQIVKLIKVFLDPRVQAYLRSTTNPALQDQLTPVSGN